MKNLGFDIVFKNRHELSRYKSGGLVLAIKRDIKLKWKTIKTEDVLHDDDDDDDDDDDVDDDGSPTLLKDVNEFRVLDYDPLYSDIHCGIHVQLKVNIEYAIINNANIAPVSNYNQPSKWRASKEEDYIAEIDENQVKELIEQMDSMDIEDNLSEEISESDKHLSELESATIESGEEETLNEPITEHEVLKAIRKLKNDKAPGYDDIVNEYIKIQLTQLMGTKLTRLG
ncbi:uncharacterized protein LOC135104017 [Scylla paramamosain]|uniref:uncharacterized protein LOC135104017 n=1 Tax=Scylla paramamosain TaxID=85552 RepID=UPI003083D36D